MFDRSQAKEHPLDFLFAKLDIFGGQRAKKKTFLSFEVSFAVRNFARDEVDVVYSQKEFLTGKNVAFERIGRIEPAPQRVVVRDFDE